MSPQPLEWVEQREDALVLCVDAAVYSDEAIFRACYAFTDRCYLFLYRNEKKLLTIRFRRRQIGTDLNVIIGEFGNELINQRIRIGLARETNDIRRLIVTHAFADAQFDAP